MQDIKSIHHWREPVRKLRQLDCSQSRAECRQGKFSFDFRPSMCIKNVNKVYFVGFLRFKDSVDSYFTQDPEQVVREQKKLFSNCNPKVLTSCLVRLANTHKEKTWTLALCWLSFRDFPRFTVGSEKMKGFRLFWACVYPDQMSGAVSVRLVPPDNAEPCQTSFLVIVAASIDSTLHFTNQYGLGECHWHLSGVQPQILKTQWWGGTVCLSFSRCLTLHVFLYFRSVPCRQLSLHKLSSNSFPFLLSTPQLSQSLLHLLLWRKPQLRALRWHGTLETLNLCRTTLSSTGPRPRTPTSKKWTVLPPHVTALVVSALIPSMSSVWWRSTTSAVGHPVTRLRHGRVSRRPPPHRCTSRHGCWAPAPCWCSGNRRRNLMVRLEAIASTTHLTWMLLSAPGRNTTRMTAVSPQSRAWPPTLPIAYVSWASHL